MKIQYFLEKLKDLILNTPDVNLRTYKLILTDFKDSLSNKEFKRWNSDITLLYNANSIQLSMKSAYDLFREKELEKELNNIKNGE